MTSDTNKNTKRKIQTDFVKDNCCRKLSIFACVCGIVSLLLHTRNNTGCDKKNDWDLNTYNVKEMEARINEKIEDYISDKAYSTSRRSKRQAILVSIF